MTAGRLSRRRLLGAAIATAAALSTASCRRADQDSRNDVAPSDDVTFTDPWSDLASDDMSALGEQAMAVDPSCIDHARNSLEPAGPSPADATEALRVACDRDLIGGEVTHVEGWLIPRTLAGLAAGLARHASAG